MAEINTFIGGQYDLHRARLAETVTTARLPVSEAVAAADTFARSAGGDGEREGLAGLRIILSLVEREARVMTYNDVWLVMAVVIAAGLLLMPFVRKVAR